MFSTVRLLCLAAILGVAFCLQPKYTSCGGQITGVRVFGCQNDTEPCTISRGTTGRLEVDFIAPFDARSLYADVRGRTGTTLVPVYVPWLGLDKNACTGHGIQCPVKRSSKQTYFYEMVIDQLYPTIKTDAIWKLTDFWGFTVACFKVDLNIA